MQGIGVTGNELTIAQIPSDFIKTYQLIYSAVLDQTAHVVGLFSHVTFEEEKNKISGKKPGI